MSEKRNCLKGTVPFFVGKIECRSVIPVVLQEWKGLTAKNFSEDIY